MEIKKLQEKTTPVLRSFGVERASVFGSVARGTAGAGSDVDLLIRFKKTPGMITYMRFVEQMQEALKRPVDIVTEKSAQKYLLPQIRQDLITIYES